MKTPLLTLVAIMALCLSLQSPGTAQVINGGFETRNSVPQALQNVGPANTVTTSGPSGPVSYTYPDDLPNWDAVAYNDAGYYNQRPGYLNTASPSAANPASFGGTTHSGDGCALVYQHPYANSHNYDNFLTEQLASPLQPGHQYVIKFWVKRIFNAPLHAKVAAYITANKPVFRSNSSANDLVLSAGSKVVTSPETYLPTDWFLVSGSIYTPSNEPNNQWLSIGASTFNQVEEAYSGQDGSDITHLIDDVSIEDLGCYVPATPIVERYDEVNDQCFRIAHYRITNYDPGVTYTINNIIRAFPNPHVISPNTTDVFTLKGGAGTDPTGSFSVTATNTCGTVTSDLFTVEYPCTEIGTARATTAYPNPASESLTLPTGATEAVLLNSQGKAIAKPDKAGRFDVQHLPAGLYNLQMQQNGKRVNQRIEVKH